MEVHGGKGEVQCWPVDGSKFELGREIVGGVTAGSQPQHR